MASTKTDLIEWIEKQEQTFPFVGCHPMAGSDLTGPENASEDLFQNATIYMTLSEKMKKNKGESQYLSYVQEIQDMWESLGAHPYLISHKQHDQWAAYLSHGLHLISCATSLLLNDIPDSLKTPYNPAGGSFQDITRVSGSNPFLWDGIIRSNSKEVKNYLSQFITLVQGWVDSWDQKDFSVEHIFEKARSMRDQVIKVSGKS